MEDNLKQKATRYEAMFSRLSERGEGAFIPFVMLGDPSLDTSMEIMDTLIESGADALELGIPFSDAVADGPVIQKASFRALEAGVTPAHCFGLLRRIREKHPKLPLGLLIYANLILAKGIKAFYAEAAEAGADSILVADIPVGAAGPFIEAAKAAGVAPVFVVPPNADEATVREIARHGRGYSYFLGRSGVTGADREMQTPLPARFKALQEAGAAPAVVGFGISTPKHIRTALEAGAAGAIAGSATVAIIEKHIGNKAAMHEALAAFVKEMKAATR
ncbi:MAG: tryptophan synthase subunit alpha [Cystobacterineae bacterium]|nr:tryptophan synthase subunit alpha [Cystobacterineae bacterium]